MKNVSPLVRTAAALWKSEPDYVIDEHARHVVFVAKTSTGEAIVIKATSDPKQAVQIDNEINASEFLGKRITSRRFWFPVPLAEEAECDGDVTSIAFDYIPNMVWFATKFPNLHLDYPMEDADLMDLCDLMLVLHGQQEKDIPEHFLNRADREFTDAHYREKLKGYLGPVVAAGYVSHDQASALESMACDTQIVRRFQHHDLVPWNLGRDSRNRLVVVDAEFARWGMAYYDVAYTFLQIYIMLGDADLARRWLTTALTAFRGDKLSIEQHIWQPMAYRFGANLHEALTRPEQMRRAQVLLPAILSRTLDVPWP